MYAMAELIFAFPREADANSLDVWMPGVGVCPAQTTNIGIFLALVHRVQQMKIVVVPKVACPKTDN